MKEYNYREQIKNDIREWMAENHELEYDYDAIYDACWVADSVTGNASGSYTFSRIDAHDDFMNDPDAGWHVDNMINDGFCTYEQVGKWIASGDWESLDVCIRCYLLGECVNEVLSELDQ